MIEFVDVLAAVLAMARLVVFALILGLTLISFQAYRRKRSDRLEAAFIGFAFLSIGIAVVNLRTQLGAGVVLEIAETIPLIIGFSMLYVSLYR